MFKKKQTENPELEKAITQALIKLQTIDPGTEDYDFLLEELVRLHKLRVVPPMEARKPVSADALITAGASIAGILIVVSYEHAHVIGSKALSFVLKK